MARDKYKGITIEIGGDVTGLTKALNSVNSQIKTTQDNLKGVEKSLKLDPKNVELLEVKERELAKAVQEATTKFEALSKAKANADKQLANGEITQAQYDALVVDLANAKAALEDARKAAADFDVDLQKVAGTLSDVSSKAADVAEKTSGISKAAQIATGAIAAGFAASVKAYAEYEQLVGGVETLFKESAGIIEQYADVAYKTAGVSANTYMETAMTFSASLLDSLGGNTKRAAEMVNMAVIDMSDNANKMGTSIEWVQRAYSGFSRQVFTMLDNLKLGYGGTKAEMQRLLENAEKLSGIHYDIRSLSDIISAIHVIQTEIGITGTTVYEAEHTIQGSINAFKAASENLVTGFGRADADINALTKSFVATFETMSDNILAAIGRIYANLPAGAQLALPFVALLAVLSPTAAAISNVSGAISTLIKQWPAIQSFLTSANGQTAAIVAILALFAALVMQIVNAWGDMSGWEKAIAVFGALVVAATAAAIALGAVQSAATMGIAAAAIVAGVIAVTAAVNSATKRAQSNQLQGGQNIPLMANGGVLSQGSAIVGEAGPELLTMAGGRAVVQPLTNNYTTNYNTSSQPLQVNIQLDGQTMARALVNPLSQQQALMGGSAAR